MMPLAITSSIVSISLVGTYPVISLDKIRLTDLICRSHTPPMCEAAGGLKSHRILKTEIEAWDRERI